MKTPPPMNANVKRLKFQKFFFSFFLSVSILLATFQAVVFHSNTFEKSNTQERISIHNDVLGYLKNNKESLPELDFTEKEIDHMKDVQHVFQGIKIITIISLIAAILVFINIYGNKNSLKWLPKQLIYAGIAVDAVVVIVALSIFLNFSSLFTFLHTLLFQPGTWQFPLESTLIQLYPQVFFEKLGICIAVTTFVIANIFIRS